MYDRLNTSKGCPLLRDVFVLFDDGVRVSDTQLLVSLLMHQLNAFVGVFHKVRVDAIAR